MSFLAKAGENLTKLGDDMTNLSRSPKQTYTIDHDTVDETQQSLINILNDKKEISEHKNDFGMHEPLLTRSRSCSEDKLFFSVPDENKNTLSLTNSIDAPNTPLILNDNDEAPIRILCIDGGGLRGCLSAQILLEMENEYRVLMGDNNVTLGNAFDLIVGTSTGGLISLGLANGLNIDEIDQLYNRVADEVFVVQPERWKKYFDNMLWHKTMDALSYFSESIGLYKLISEPARYDTDKLKEICQDVLKDNDLYREDEFNDEETHYKLPHAAVLSVRTDVQTSQPFVFRTYDLEGSEDAYHHIDRVLLRPFAGTSQAKCWEAAMATSAAPTYFKAMRVNVHNTDCLFVDGGLAANDPSIVGIIEARNKYPDKKLFVISVGTGKARNKLSPKRKKGTLSLLASTANAAFNVKEAVNRTIVRNLLREGEEYFRLNTLLKEGENEMSAEELMGEWRQSGHDYVQNPYVKKKVKEIMKFLFEITERNMEQK